MGYKINNFYPSTKRVCVAEIVLSINLHAKPEKSPIWSILTLERKQI